MVYDRPRARILCEFASVAVLAEQVLDDESTSPTSFHYPRAWYTRTFPYFAEPRAHALSLQIAYQHRTLIVPCQGCDEHRVDARELPQRREHIRDRAATRARYGTSTRDRCLDGGRREGDDVSDEERAGRDDADGAWAIRGIVALEGVERVGLA